MRLALRFSDTVVFLSNLYKEQVRERLPSIYKDDKVAVIPNGIDLEVYRPGERTASDKFVLGMQSRLVGIKDHRTLLSAFVLVKQRQPGKNLCLKIAGDGEFRTALQEKAKESGIAEDVEFMGTLGEQELLRFTWSLDVYIHASLGETMSTAIMQAMACKKAIVASDVTGINNMLVNNETGLLVPVKDPEAMAAAIEQLISNRQQAERLAVNAYDHAMKNYSNMIMFKRYKKLFYN